MNSNTNSVLELERSMIEDRLREIKRQRVSLARQIGTQEYSAMQFSAINEEINTLEYSLRERYGYALLHSLGPLPEEEAYEQRDEETGGEFLERLMSEDPFAAKAECSNTSTTTTTSEQQNDDGHHAHPETTMKGQKRPSDQEHCPEEETMGIIGSSQTSEIAVATSPGAIKRQRVAKTALDIVLEEEDQLGRGDAVGVFSSRKNPSPPRPKAKVANGFDAIFMQTPLPASSSTTLRDGSSRRPAPPSSAPTGKQKPLTTPLSAPAATTINNDNTPSFFTRVWGKIRGGRPSPNVAKQLQVAPPPKF